MDDNLPGLGNLECEVMTLVGAEAPIAAEAPPAASPRLPDDSKITALLRLLKLRRLKLLPNQNQLAARGYQHQKLPPDLRLTLSCREHQGAALGLNVIRLVQSSLIRSLTIHFLAVFSQTPT